MKYGDYELLELKMTDDPGEPKGLFAALVSVFGNVDRVGDRVLPGAFTKSLKKWRESGKPVPVIWSHDRMNPDGYIGSVDPVDVRETAKGLVVAGKLDIEDNPQAMKVYNLMRKGYVTDWSFGYEVKQEQLAKDLARELVEVDLFEVGPTLVGANPEAQTLALKEAGDEDKPPAEIGAKLDPIISEEFAAFDTKIEELIEGKIGRAISAKTEAKIRKALEALTDLLAGEIQASEDVAPVQEASASPQEKSEEPTVVSENEVLRRDIDKVGLS